MKFVFKKRLKYFGGPIKLDDSSAADDKRNAVDFPPFEDKSFNVYTLQQNKCVQFIAQRCHTLCQTEVKCKKTIGTQYVSREFVELEKDRILRSEEMNTFMQTASHRLLDVFEQQELVDAFSAN
ncbi:hypothetical protein CHUAL_004814 [Chamberlinius hualienensis]